MNGKAYWVDAQGRILTAGQIAALVGAPVTEQIVHGVGSLVSDRISGVVKAVRQRCRSCWPGNARRSRCRVVTAVQQQADKPDVKCIGVDNEERECDGSKRLMPLSSGRRPIVSGASRSASSSD